MKKKLSKVAIIAALGFIGLVSAIQVSAKSVQVFQIYNRNIYSGAISNTRNTYQNVPNNYKIQYTRHTSYRGGWNYDVHEIYYHWNA
ncbi:hypothetical protein [Enterococcus sp. AZ102]|uniref:hypothetical protein n=1 Tax=unclassified Enterococcus TaxID=2608891 RepID=UPI003F26EE2F